MDDSKFYFAAAFAVLGICVAFMQLVEETVYVNSFIELAKEDYKKNHSNSGRVSKEIIFSAYVKKRNKLGLSSPDLCDLAGRWRKFVILFATLVLSVLGVVYIYLDGSQVFLVENSPSINKLSRSGYVLLLFLAASYIFGVVYFIVRTCSTKHYIMKEMGSENCDLKAGWLNCLLSVFRGSDSR